MSTTETKTTAPRTETANPFAAFSQFPQFPQLGAFDPMATWSKLMTESYARMTAFAEHYAGLEAQLMTRAQGAVASWAQLSQDAIACSGQWAAEARKLSVDALKKFSAAA